MDSLARMDALFESMGDLGTSAAGSRASRAASPGCDPPPPPLSPLSPPPPRLLLPPLLLVAALLLLVWGMADPATHCLAGAASAAATAPPRPLSEAGPVGQVGKRNCPYNLNMPANRMVPKRGVPSPAASNTVARC